MRGWIEWFARGLWKRRRPIQVVVAITVGFALLVVVLNRDYLFDRRPPRTMSDPVFERAANKICADKIPSLRAVRRENKTDSDLEQQTARDVDRAAARLSLVVTDLRALPVRPADKAQVRAWFTAFDSYIAAGQHYAEALRGGNENVYNKVDDEGIAPLKAISHFGRANRIDACIP